MESNGPSIRLNDTNRNFVASRPSPDKQIPFLIIEPFIVLVSLSKLHARTIKLFLSPFAFCVQIKICIEDISANTPKPDSHFWQFLQIM